MSFSDQVKEELTRIDLEEECCDWAELAALIKLNGSLEIKKNKFVLKIVSQKAVIARKVYSLLKEKFDFLTKIIVRRGMYLNKDNHYIIKLPPQNGVKELLLNCGLITDECELSHQIQEELVVKRCCQKSYLRGVFLAGGSINDPDSSYHLEIWVDSHDYALELTSLIKEKFQLEFKIRSRNGDYLLYLKKAEDIVKVLNIIGAHSALLNFENTRVLKEVRNQVNRIVNCETANLNKTIEAARKQIENIKLIEKVKGLDSLTPSLQEIARLRLENPYVSLKELGELLEPSLSKSGVNHRLRRIKKIAKEIKEEKSWLN